MLLQFLPVLVFLFVFQCASYTHLLCVTEHNWDPQLCNMWRLLKYWFQMKKGTTLSCLSCHGNVWNVSCAPEKMNTGKSPHASSNWQLLCFFGVPARNVIIGEMMLSLFLPPAVHILWKKTKNVCVRVFNSQRRTKEWQRKWWKSRSVSELSEELLLETCWLICDTLVWGDNLLLSATCSQTGRWEEFSLSCNTTYKLERNSYPQYF